MAEAQSGPWAKYQSAGAPMPTPAETPPWLKYQAPQSDSSPSLGEDVAVLAQKGLSLGTAPFIAGTAGGLSSAISGLGSDSNQGILERVKSIPQNFAQGFSQAREDLQNKEAGAIQRHPIIGGLAEMVGGLPTMALMPTIPAETALARMAAAAQGGAIMGAGNALGNANNLSDAAKSVEGGALTGGLLQGGLESLPYLANAAKTGAGWAGKKAVTVLLGPKTEAIDAYLERAPQIAQAKSLEDLKATIDDAVSGYVDAVDSGKTTLAQAKQGLKDIGSQTKQIIGDTRFEFQVNKADVNDALRQAENNLSAKYGGAKAALEAVKAPLHIAQDVNAALGDLKKEIINGSAESYKILGEDSSQYSLNGVSDQLKSIVQDMNIGGNKTALTDEAISAQNKIMSLADRIDNMGKVTVTAPEMKTLIQELDQSGRANWEKTRFDDPVSIAYKSARSALDTQIKARNPYYRAIMETVADNTRFYQDAVDRFGDTNATISKINSIANATRSPDRNLLIGLGQRTGYDFQKPIEQFAEAQATLKNPAALQNLKAQFPEYAQVEALGNQSRQLTRPETLPGLQDAALAKAGIPELTNAQNLKINDAQAALGTAENALEPIRRLTPSSTQAVVKNLFRDPELQSIEGRKALEELSKMSNQDFMQAIKDLRTQKVFEGEYRNGSRNVVLGGVIGFVTGGVPGMIAGSGAGGVVDRYGPQVAKKVLDGYLAVAQTPTIQAVSNLNIPIEAKEYIAKTLVPAAAGAFLSPVERRMNQNQGGR